MAGRRSNVVRAAILPATDDLTKIKGVGPLVAARLRDAGILTFAQLVGLTSEEISARVAGLSTKRIAHEKWIKQAQRLASKTESIPPSKRETTREPRQHYATFTVELLLSTDNNVRRTRVTNIQTNSKESWAGWSEPRLSNFIANCANLERPKTSFAPEFPTSHGITQSPEPPAPSSQTTDLFYKVHLTDSKPKNVLCGILKVGNLAVIILGTNTPQHSVHANEAFSVRITLDLTDVEVAPSTPLNCTITIWAKKLGAGVRQIVGEQDITFIPAEKIPCVIESRIPEQGTYRLEAMSVLTPTSTSPATHSTLRAWHEGGMLQVY